MAPQANNLPRPLRGIIPPMVTPLADRDTLDTAGLQRLIEHILSGGVHGLFILGTTGEGPSLSYRLRCQLIDRVCEQVAGRVPVLVGISDTAFIESVNLAEYAADAGAQALVLTPPYYFPMGQVELQQYVAHIAAELPLPLMLYNIPSHTKVRFELDTVRGLMEIANVAGIKDSCADMIFFQHLCRLAAERSDWTVLMGPEELLADAVLSGGHGGVCGGANLCPQLYVDLYHAAQRRDMDQVAQLRARVLWIAKNFYTIARHGAAVTAALKCALRSLEICDDFMAEPFQRLTDPQRDAIQAYLAEADLRSYLPSARCRQ